MIPGVIVIPEAFSPSTEKELLDFAESGTWRRHPFGKREQVWYGPSVRAGRDGPGLPAWALAFVAHIGEPYRLIISDYEPGVGMAMHEDSIDRFPIMGCIYSILSPADWVFVKESTHVPVHVPPRSLLTLMGEGRYEWKHEVLPVRSRRISFYFSFDATRVQAYHGAMEPDRAAHRGLS